MAQKQLKFEIKTHGGRRSGAGRKKRLISAPNHVAREKVTARTPMHITLKVLPGFRSLRLHARVAAFARALREAAKFGLRVQHYSIQKDHIHFIAEADSNKALAQGMQSLSIRYAKAIHATARVWGHAGKGTVFQGRYHLHVLKTPTEVKNALRYVLGNLSHHFGDGAQSRSKPKKARSQTGVANVGNENVCTLKAKQTPIASIKPKLKFKPTRQSWSRVIVDPCSSAHRFTEWRRLFGTKCTFVTPKPPKDLVQRLQKEGEYLSEPRSWLLDQGWKRA